MALLGLWFNLLFILFSVLTNTSWVAGHLSESQHGFFSFPLHPRRQLATSPGGKGLHAAIVHQQHTNRGIRRLSLMTNRKASNSDLSARLQERICSLPEPLQAAYGCRSLNPRTVSPLNVGLRIESRDVGYMTTVQIGTPSQDFTVLIDSGSADFWVGAEGCHGDDGGDCGPHVFIGQNSSRTFKKTKNQWAIGYVTGVVFGFTVRDTVSIGPLTMTNYQFGAALNESSDFTAAEIPFDGLLGFAKEMISKQDIPTFLDSLFQRKLIPAPIVSYKIPRLSDGRNDGEMTLGGLNPKAYRPSTLVRSKNINKFGFWEVKVDRVKMGTHNFHFDNVSIVFDTGTTLLIVPQKAAEIIHNSIPGATYVNGGWAVPCNLTSRLTLTIQGQGFPINPGDLAFAPLDENDPASLCTSGIGVGGVGPFYPDNEWLAGDIFLKNVYFSTDSQKDEISIAKLHN